MVFHRGLRPARAAVGVKGDGIIPLQPEVDGTRVVKLVEFYAEQISRPCGEPGLEAEIPGGLAQRRVAVAVGAADPPGGARVIGPV